MPHVTRRSFLEHTFRAAATGLASATAYRAVAQEHSSTSSTRPGPNERVGIAIIGLHGRGLDHLDAYTFDDRVEIVALCDVDEATFGKAQRKLSEHGRGTARQYRDVRKLVEDKDVHAVSMRYIKPPLVLIEGEIVPAIGRADRNGFGGSVGEGGLRLGLHGAGRQNKQRRDPFARHRFLTCRFRAGG